MSYNRLIQIDGKLVVRNGNRVIEVAVGSPAQKAGIGVGDYLLKIDDRDIKDILDYKYLSAVPEMTLVLKRSDSEEIYEVKIEKDTYEDLGLSFQSGIIDKASRCSNNCIFCFIDQLPKGMRETLYFKDDDSRLSFLQGNFVTLTNMTESDIKRIIEYRISPINISVHTTNPELRVRMLNNRNAGRVFEIMKRLSENRIIMNAQIVLVPGYNDGDELTRTLKDLGSLYPNVNAVAIVPLGMTKFREGLTELTPFDSKSAGEAIDVVSEFQKDFLEKHGTHFARCADEFYVMAGRDVPSEEFYEGYEQLEDGIGMIRIFRESVEYDSERLKKGKGTFSFVTGTSAYEEVKRAAQIINGKNPEIKTEVFRVRNDFFGHSITVAGLLTGQDVIKNLKGSVNSEYLVMPRNMFRSGEDVMLDGVTIDDLERELSVKVLVVDYTGEDLIDRINEKLRRNRRKG